MDHNPVGWFEIATTDLDRAQKFYENVFEWQGKMQRQVLEGFDMAWFPMSEDMNARGAMGALCAGEMYKPGAHGTIVYFTCPDIEATLKRAEDHGGKVCLPKKDIGEYGYIALFTDSEGNIIGLHTAK